MRPEVWAPRAGDVALVTGERQVAMRRCRGGWFAADVDLAAELPSTLEPLAKAVLKGGSPNE